MNDPVDFTSVGALPSLDAKEGEVLGAPESKAKSKTNVGKVAVLGLALAAFLFIIAGLLMYQKHKQKTAEAAPAAKVEAAKPGFSVKNTAVENESIDKAKAEIKKKEDEENARQKALADAQKEAQRQAEEDAKKRGAGNPSGQRNQYAGQPAQSQAQASQQATPRELTPAERKMASGVLLDTTGAKPKGDSQLSEKDQQQREVQARLAAAGVGANVSSAGMVGQASQQGGGSQGTDSIGARLQPTVLQARSAGKLPNLDFLLKKGTSIPCALKTGIDTTLPGFVICEVLNDVYSANGKTLLVERGATVFGEQQSSLKQGQERTFVVWTRIDNPSGVFANIDSPATDQMGYSGIPGYVDTHFWKRFGGAIMLSLIRDFSQAAAQRSSGGTSSGTPVYSNTQNATQEMAAEALRNTINIPPTLVVNPATIVNVMVARDVSFENVFAVVE